MTTTTTAKHYLGFVDDDFDPSVAAPVVNVAERDFEGQFSEAPEEALSALLKVDPESEPVEGPDEEGSAS